MKKLIIILVTSLLLFSCFSKEPVKKYLVTIVDGSSEISDEVLANEDYTFTLSKDQTYNKVFVNGIEIKADSDGIYTIREINEDKLITFNSQYQITISKGLGYDVDIISGHSLLVNAGENVKFKLRLALDYDKSMPKVFANEKEIEVLNGEFMLSDIDKNILIAVKEVYKNQVVIKPKPEVLKDPVAPSEPDYSFYANNDLSWWYRYPARLNSDIKPTIDLEVSNLIKKYNGVWMLDTNEKVVVLTMDEGYEFENNTTEILDIAAKKGVPITFFITGGYLESQPDLVLRMINEGHVVANHSDKHLRASPALNNSNQTFIDDIKNLENKFTTLTNKNITKIYRPPEGGYSERSLAITKDLGYKTVFWSFAYRDWLTDDQPNPEVALSRIISEIHPGAILLLHAVSNTNVAILEQLIDEVRALGYSFTTIPN